LSRKSEQRLADIVLCCEKILRFTAGIDQGQLAEDELVTDAVLWNIAVIGEATKTLPDDVRDQIPGIEWKKIAGMRDWIIHVYHRVDPDIVWDVVETEIPKLLGSIRLFFEQDPP
jgi:uncharacterized protein with HEPN domain